MARLVLLDAGPLGLAGQAAGKAPADHCRAWLAKLELAGIKILIPEIADYEVRRELLRLGATAGIRRLNDLKARYDYRPITTSAILKAAEFWALLRHGGQQTAGPDDVDADAILAGMGSVAGKPGDAVTIATTNVRHLGRFPGIDARQWNSIS